MISEMNAMHIYNLKNPWSSTSFQACGEIWTNVVTFALGYRMHSRVSAVNGHVMTAIPFGDIVYAVV